MVGAIVTQLILSLFWSLLAEEPPAAGVESEAAQVLTSAGYKTDTESLLAFFRSRTLAPGDRANLAATVCQLGDDSYEIRSRASSDLTAMGAPAIPFLQAALSDPDPEIARRAHLCLETIQRGPGAIVPQAAVRLLALRKPPAAVEVLLGYVPFADDESVEDTVFGALLSLGMRNGNAEERIRQAVADPEPARRQAAAFILGQSEDSAKRRFVHKLLTDPIAKVRLHTARALLAHGDKLAVSPLIALLTDSPPELAWQAEDLLARIANDSAPRVYLDSDAEETRRKCRSAWEAWWQIHEASFEPTGLKLEPRYLGMTLIADLDKGRVLELGPDHKERWKINGFGGPVDVHLLGNGHVLVAENHARQVTERDRTGKIVWKKATSAYPASCQRLPNGNTFIATYSQLLELTPDGREVLKVDRPDGIYAAQKLRNGHIVFVTSAGRVTTLDAAGKQIKQFETGGIIGWSSLDILPNGHVVACCTPDKVVEFDGNGKRIWECSVPNAVSARRLPNGNTLVCSSEKHRVVEVDRLGKEVWEVRTEGRPWHVRVR
jgi:HEAT repeat protein